MTETTFHAGATRRVKTADGGHADYSINVSGISISASDEFIRMAVERAEFTLGVITEEIERRIASGVQSPSMRTERVHAPRVNPSAFESHQRDEAERRVTPEESARESLGLRADGWSLPLQEKKGLDHTPDGREIDPFDGKPVGDFIPDPQNVSMTGSVFGVEIPHPHFTWCAEPVTRVNNDGNGGGQLKALNTALSAAGHKGVKRHPASLAVLQAYGEIHGYEVRDSLDSLNDLTKAEAHVILSFFELADSNALTSLRIALEVACLR